MPQLVVDPEELSALARIRLADRRETAQSLGEAFGGFPGRIVDCEVSTGLITFSKTWGVALQLVAADFALLADKVHEGSRLYARQESQIAGAMTSGRQL